ncbi:MAG: tripartite tricarboxylate transporter substrate binding protein [Clostridia bacterium]|nr:tripartite tricarboxylate transporter substrate binding protein [Clostridia bacterium]
MNKKIISLLLILLFGLTLGLTGCQDGGNGSQKGSAEEGYPSKDITVIIPFSAGGASDVQARIVEKYFKDEFGVNLIITYKEGAGGEIGFSEVAKAKPDGYTIGSINIPHIVLQPLARETQFNYDDFAIIGQMVNDPQVIAVLKDSKYNTLQDLIDDAKANPGKITLGNVGTFSGHHIASLNLMDLTGTEFTLVPYKGSADQIVALQGGHVQAIMGNLNDVMRDLDKYKLLAISTEERHSFVPDVPTFKEQGLDLISGITRVWAAPKDIAPETLARLREGFERIAKNPEYLADMEKIGQPEEWLTGEEVEEQLKIEVEKATALLEKYGLLEQK